MRVLVVEDEPRLRGALREALEKAGYTVDTAGDGVQGLEAILDLPCDAVVLDIMLPRLSGLDVCRTARKQGRDVPILLLTARDSTADKVAGLDAGADDYLVKPFEIAELLARVRALLRRQGGRKQGVLQVADLVLDPATGDVTRGGKPVVLARKQRALLEYLLRSAGRIVTRDQILEHVWDFAADPESDVVRAQVKLLRKAIGDTGRPRLIETVHGIGYRMADDVPIP